MIARQDNTAAQLVAGHVKPLDPGGPAAPSQPYAPALESDGGATVRHDAIAAEAYALWAERGYQEGNDVDDWLEAERRLRDGQRLR